MSAIFVPLVQGGFYLSAGDADAQDEPRIGAWAATLARHLRQSNSPNSPPVDALENRGRPLVRILKASHHGSRTSSAPEFLRAVAPTEIWISDGRGNHYGHPSLEVLERFETLHIPILRTDEQGSIRAEGVRRRPPEHLQ